MRSSAPVRALLGVVVAGVVACTSISLTTSSARGDAGDGGTIAVASYRTDAAKITAGGRHACSIEGTAQKVYCWGDNSSGQLGNGTTVSSAIPVQVVGLTGVTAISAGDRHTCAVLGDGTGRCWGDNSHGQLGNGSTTSSSTPVTPAGSNTFTSIAAGTDFTCGTTATQVRCWGLNTLGQNGTGNLVQHTAPTAALSGAGTPQFVAAGGAHACAVMGGSATNGGTAYCWGDNSQGQLGLGAIGGIQTTPQVLSLTNVDQISAGGLFTCGHSGTPGSGGNKCWGYNANGQLGNGGTTTTGVPTNIFNPDPLGERVMSVGVNHTCATENDEVRCWGSNAAGQLGDGTNNSTPFPNPVPPGDESGVPTVTAGDEFTCARYFNGAVDCWGRNDKGQLGNGTTTGASSAVHALARPHYMPGVRVKPADHGFTFLWTPPTNVSPPITGYHIADLDGHFSLTAPADASSFTVTGLTEGQTYRAFVAPVNDVGEANDTGWTNVTINSQPYFEVNDRSVVEGDSGSQTVTFTVTRFAVTNTAASVKYSTSDGDGYDPGIATQPTDYTRKAPTVLSFPAGVTTKTFTVTVKGDKLAEYDEVFHVNLTDPVGGDTWDGRGDATIVNNDPGAPPYYVVDDAASVLEGNSGTHNMTFTVHRYGSTAVAGSVKFGTAAWLGGGDTHATPGEDFTAKTVSLSFAVGVTSKTVTVAVKGDLVAEEDEELLVGLFNGVNGSIGYYEGQASGIILNDDSTDPPSIAIGDLSFAEGDGFSRSVTFTITRSGNLAGTTTLKYHTEDGTAVAPSDYTAKSPTSLTLGPGVVTKTFTITVKGGSVVEPDETFSVVLSDVTGASVTHGTATATIVNDD